MPVSNSTESEDHCSQRSRTNSWENKQPQAIVWDPLDHKLSFETEETLNKNWTSFPVHLPRWRNRVDIYLDAEKKSGLVTSIDVGQIGVAKNLKRRLGYNYRVLHVKGAKPRVPSRLNKDSTASMTSK